MTPDQLLERAVVDDPARPLLTYYDDAADERAELSVVTFANWVAKTANLLVDGLRVQPGQRVAVHLPTHWQGAVWHSACWAAGLTTVTGPGGARADIAVVPLEPGDDMGAMPDLAEADEVVGLGLGPLGLPRRGVAVPAHVTLDYDREIHSYGDHFGPRAGNDPDRPALAAGGVLHTGGDLAAGAVERIRVWALAPGARILTLAPFDDLAAVLAGLLVPLANGGGTILCRHAERSRLGDRARSEQVTAVTDLPEGVLPLLPRLT